MGTDETMGSISPTPPMKIAGPGSRNGAERSRSLTRKDDAWKALAEIEKAAGGREELAHTLGLAESGENGLLLIRLMMDPARVRDSLSRIVADAGMTPSQVLGLFRDAGLAKAMALSQHVLNQHLPAVVQDVAEKSVDAVIACDCVKVGGVVNPDCEKCAGVGKIFRRSSLPHQELLMEAAGFLKKGGGVNVQVNQQVVNAPKDFFDGFVRGTDDAAYSIDAEVVSATTGAGSNGCPVHDGAEQDVE